MSKFNYTETTSRNIRTPPVSARRLMREDLDLSMDLDHDTDERLPLAALETQGVGYGFDKLYLVNLKTGKRIETPASHDITKRYRRSTNRVSGLNQGFVARGGLPLTQVYKLSGGNNVIPSPATTLSTATSMAQPVFYTDTVKSTGAPSKPGNCGWISSNIKEFAFAKVGDGHSNGASVGFWTTADGVGLDINTTGTDSIEAAGTDLAIATASVLHATMGTFAWETLLSIYETLGDMALHTQDLSTGLFQLYERERSTARFNKISSSDTVRLAIDLIELGAALRTGSFSRNVRQDTYPPWFFDPTATDGPVWTTGLNTQGYTRYKIDGSDVVDGTYNEFFHHMVTADGEEWVMAPWWLINKFDRHTFRHEEGLPEQERNVEIDDMFAALTLLMEVADVEKGLGFGSDSMLPMFLFDKFKEGVLKSYNDFTSSESAISATMLGYNGSRNLYNDKADNAIGRVPYFPSLVSKTGTIFGAKKLEFTERIEEHANHAITVASSDNFKKGMSYTAAYDYNTMVTRTRFGDHMMDVQVYPAGWLRVNHRFQMSVRMDYGSAQSLAVGTVVVGGVPDTAIALEDHLHVLPSVNTCMYNVHLIPFYGWGQLCEDVGTNGFLPLGQNGMSYPLGVGLGPEIVVADVAHGDALDLLWPENYYRPGLDNSQALTYASTNELYQMWADRAENVRSESAEGPSFTGMNLMTEMTFTTPPALLQRNFPFLRKMLTQPGTSTVPVSTNASMDFMTAGDNRHGMSVWAGTTPWALEDRALFDVTAHARTGSLELVGTVLPLSNAPENWVSVFQCRDALMFLTSLASEPIMDAYTASQANSGTNHNGYVSARLVLYQGTKHFDGHVLDVYCTPLSGVAGNSANVDRRAMSSTAELTLFPGAAAADGYNDYTMWLLGKDRLAKGVHATEGALCSRNGLDSSGAAACTLTPLVGMTGTLSEDDFVPGLYWQKLWVTAKSATQVWNRLFTDYDATGALSFLNPSTGSDTNAASIASIAAFADVMRQFIETERVGLEFQRAAPNFFIFDKDILDAHESRLRQHLYPLGKSTIGPLTYVGGITAEGTSALTETITGPSVFEVLDLSLGAVSSAFESSDPEVDDIATGETNPSMHIADKQEV